jgi:hypothetical protein
MSDEFSFKIFLNYPLEDIVPGCKNLKKSLLKKAKLPISIF